MKLPLVTVPNPQLRQISQSVKNVDKKTVQLLNDMIDTLVKKEDPPGVGLSAVQVGKLWRIFVINMPPIHDLETFDDDSPASEIKVFINPEIVDKSEKLTLGPDKKHPIPEGCLSIPNLYGPILRHRTVKVKYLDENLNEKTDTFSNFYGRVVQHEYDHLDAILFTDLTLKQEMPIYFDQGDRLIKVPEPAKLINW